MTSREYIEWVAFYQLEPWGYAADNFRAATIAAVIANTARDTKKRRKPFQPADFMPQEPEGTRRRVIDQATLRAKLDTAMFAWGGRKRAK